jgi:hypothetical protein
MTIMTLIISIIASIVIVAVMFGLNGIFDESELAINPTPEMDSIGPTEITIGTFVLHMW